MSSHHHQHTHANHAHNAPHDHIDSDYAPLYELDWIKNLLNHIGVCLEHESSWIGMSSDTPQRILDYACGNGVVSRALAVNHPHAMFQGIDLATSQVERYNREAARIVNENGADNDENAEKRTMYAVQGDILDPTAPLDKPEWKNFDIAIMSMALHHMKDPVVALDTLRRRVRNGGTLVVIDWWRKSSRVERINAAATATTNGDGETTSSSSTAAKSTVKKYNEESMITVLGGNLKIWPAFSTEDIQDDLRAAGCMDVDVIVYPEDIEGTEEMGKHNKFFIAKATVP